MKWLIISLLLSILISNGVERVSGSTRNAFVYTQLKYSGEWDPYPEIWQEILSFLTTTTSVKAAQERKVLTISRELFNYPFIWLLGRGDFPQLSCEEIKVLRNFFDRGGMMFIEDVSDMIDSQFRQKVKSEFSRVFPEKNWKKIPLSHALFRSFYLLRRVSGRKIWRDYLEGISFGDRFVVILSANDISGTWRKDRFGNYLYECIPGKDKQRWEAQKLTINVILYALTGTYKSDAVHQPFIERKLR